MSDEQVKAAFLEGIDIKDMRDVVEEGGNLKKILADHVVAFAEDDSHYVFPNDFFGLHFIQLAGGQEELSKLCSMDGDYSDEDEDYD